MPRRLFSALLVLLLSGALHPLQAQRFEGVLHQRTIEVSLLALEDRGFDVSESIFDMPIEDILALRNQLESRGEMTVVDAEIAIKGDRIRMDASDEDGPGYATVDAGSGVVRMMRPEEGIYIEMTPTDFEQMASFSGGFEDEPAEIIPTGQSRAINGMQATAYDVVSGDEYSRIWVSRDDAELVAAFQELADGMSSMSMGDAVDPSMLVAEYGLPVLTQTLGYDMYSIEEIVSVDRRAVSDDLFEPSAGLERMTMEDLMGGAVFSDMPPGAAGDPDERAGQALAGLMGGMEAAPAWIEYDVSGVVEASGREEDVVMCSETGDGFQSRSLGDVIIGLEADGGGEGLHQATVTLDGPDGRFTGRGSLTIRSMGQDDFGFGIYEVDFEGADLEASAGGVVHVRGSMACAAM